MLKKFSLLLILSIFLFGCAHKPLSEQQLHSLGNIVDLKTQQPIRLSELLQKLPAYSYVLIGEEHNQPVHHQIETYLVQKLAQKRPLAAVILEMLSVDQQAKINQLQQQQTTLLAEEVPAQIGWKHWDWHQYQDLIISRLSSTIPLIAANLTETEVKTLYTGAQPLRGSISVTPQVRMQLAQLIQAHHSLPPNILEKAVTVQQFRDRRMAEMLVKNTQNSTAYALLVAGNNHVRKDLAVPLHLQDFDHKNKAKTISIMLKSQRSEAETVTLQQADYVWFTE
ncbi:ChaN family lipoprotein [Actinobacillus equuli]|uniref:ChaN family lipoprotein n=1 Tax=Actinobacillus equuli TaxID=718 RepID=UPI002442A072|nr:ChaN family lipoprotein [Actinobacillus equuli]WGE52568.1 ChaN family lipoprotein [Actinobacillus equuli subsp. haemolyticus]WGE58811.1 ChaN family lipoprotein [Actinobacillus equuli subsp. haemolyticus]WGE60592.1 ChaN family lipoprotein [Actinobacillus equuli subsp. haemolyticus]WGE73011.1 ChaN family lipoprotein [Actinobacillus equuli subsp. haemolyticus]